MFTLTATQDFRVPAVRRRAREAALVCAWRLDPTTGALVCRWTSRAGRKAASEVPLSLAA